MRGDISRLSSPTLTKPLKPYLMDFIVDRGRLSRDLDAPPAVDMHLPMSRAPKARCAQAPSLLARLHRPRIMGLTIALSLWPAIIYAVSRFL